MKRGFVLINVKRKNAKHKQNNQDHKKISSGEKNSLGPRGITLLIKNESSHGGRDLLCVPT